MEKLKAGYQQFMRKLQIHRELRKLEGPKYYRIRASFFWLLFFVCCVIIGWGLWYQNSLKQKADGPSKESVHWIEKVPEPAKSKLKDPESCYLCGKDDRSLMSMFRNYEDLGVICVNDWYVLNMRIRNYDDSGNLLGAQGHTNMTMGSLGEGGHSYSCHPNSDRGISEVTIYDGEKDTFDVKKVKDHLCQDCLDKVLEVMAVYAPEQEAAQPRDLCLVDFQTLELYSLQGDYSAYYVRDYYVQVDDSREGEVKVKAVYAPILENGHKEGE